MKAHLHKAWLEQEAAVLWTCLLGAKVASNWLEFVLDATRSSRRLIVSNGSRKHGKRLRALCCCECRLALFVCLAFVSTLAKASAKLVHTPHNCCLQRPLEMTVCHNLNGCMQRPECNQHHCKLLQSPSLRKRLLVHSVSARSAGCNLLKIFARASSWADRQIFSRDIRTRAGIAFAQSQMICRRPATAEAKQAGPLEPKLTGRTSKVALEHSAEAIRLQAWKRCHF